MSSMLKKTGGLSFKPKAGRRPGAGVSKPPANSISATTTRATTTEPQSQASTPAASNPSTPAVLDPVEAVVDEPNKPPTPAELLPTPTNLQTPSASRPYVEISAVQLTSEPVISPPPSSSLVVIQNPTPQTSNEVVRHSVPCPEPCGPTVDTSRHDTQQAPSAETENNPPSTTDALSQPSAITPATTSEPSSPEAEAAPGPPTAPPSPPLVSDTIPAAISQPLTPKKPTSRRRKSTVIDGGTDAEDSAPKKRRQRRKSSIRATTETEEGASAEVQKPTKRRKRDPTPENAEELTVDHSTMTVGELTKDLGIGKRFRHAEEIEQRAREARAKNRLKRLEREKRKLGLALEDEDEASLLGTSNESSETRGAAMAQLGASMDSGGGQGVGYDVVDGQIVVHAASLVVDRHNRDMTNLEEVEENDFTNCKLIAQTEKFYRLLGMFGTDFETISRLFPGKNRRAIKLKFNKEERLRPNRINAAMMVRGQKKVNIDIEEYKASQRQWQAKDKILEEHAKLAQEHEQEVTRLREERRAAGLIDDDEGRAVDANPKSNGSGQESGDLEVTEEDVDALGQGGQDRDVDMDTQPEGIQA
ncbi:hypothetical protein E0Z10_g6760 [Xylaria hypoxylon]|uniref:Transcription factor TFIIIB component B'' Myb domain-containing protein n=1 Tax=Xylaria hypoxylon TaxID=37992 RepID=A0A4Z0YSF2_9PEZI|nr:hypothetical protein E0Z10_g6760 [Xylaria hypoxylon]